MEHLITKLQTAGLIDDMGNIILEIYSEGMYQAVDIDTFKNYFGFILDDNNIKDKFTALVEASTGKGYSRFFKQWKEQGVL